MNYLSITPDQREEMLTAIGVDSVNALFDAIPASSRFDGTLNLPEGASELTLQRELSELAGMNAPAAGGACFMGAGAYDHFYPTFIDQFILRGEFLTAYTPYQAEASQGSLQAFFEFQSQIARLTGLDIANASLYDGASAACEAVNLALNATGKRRVLIASTVHPDTLKTVRTHLSDLPVEFITLPAGEDGVIGAATVREHADSDTACVIVQSPNVFGLIEDWTACFDAAVNASEQGAAPLKVALFNPIACALLKNPGDCGADVAAGEGQPLGIPLQYGGPYLGLFSARQSLIRKMPGRLVGEAFDSEGRRGFALILQTREQHIRGAKATSNVCTNQGLLALRATMYMTAMGPGGIREVAEHCWHKAHALAKRIAALPGYSLKHDSEFFHEFVVECPCPAQKVIDAGRKTRVWPGVALATDRMGQIGAANELLVAVTEKRTNEDLDALIALMKGCA
jgi:glycine dehydrogenase subunit 1